MVGHELISSDEARMLTDKIHPWESGTMYYAAVAGVMLSVAGFISGFIDNSKVFHKVSERVRGGGGVFRLVPGSWLHSR